jgi:FkbM family methyltransferase
MDKNKIELGGLFYPTKDALGQDIPFDSLFIPYIYKEIYLEGVYLDVLNGKKDLTIIDVGANIGITVDHFRRYAKKLYAIEPSSEHFAALSKNKEFNKWDNVELVNVALADKDGETSLSHHAANRTCHSITNKYQEDDEIVPTMAIDTLFEKYGIEEVDFMKFDPEGAEDLILRSEGFKKVAHKIKAIECEFHYPTWPKLVELLQGLGFQARRYDSSAIIVLFFR